MFKNVFFLSQAISICLLAEPLAELSSFSLEEMLFASKLTDQNRHKFCYEFSPKERSLILLKAKESDPNLCIEKGIAEE